MSDPTETMHNQARAQTEEINQAEKACKAMVGAFACGLVTSAQDLDLMAHNYSERVYRLALIMLNESLKAIREEVVNGMKR
jgi:hypothetical protein